MCDPAAEYAAGQIAGARLVPITELRRHLRVLFLSADVVAYCRGPYSYTLTKPSGNWPARDTGRGG